MHDVQRFRTQYGIAAAVVLVIEVAIALFAHDDVLMPYIGGSLAIVGVYCLMRMFVPTGHKYLPFWALLVGVAVEIMRAIAYIGPFFVAPFLYTVLLGSVLNYTNLVFYVFGAIPCLVESVYRH